MRSFFVVAAKKRPAKRAFSQMSRSWKSVVHEGAQLVSARGLAQLLERLRLDLADAFARDAKTLAHFLQRVLAGAADAEAHAQDALLALGEVGERLGDELAELARLRRRQRIVGVRRLDQVGEAGIAVLADRR